ncbi:Retinoic acid receptor responder protein 1 [Camelus dromedarius]|uniref:Retinoic acid receptor responder protein 1 n=1 Tax=Camelus dromedarius TaxID=9838 RepID=A0A5N4EJ28_CAMDR|nr:Retinoic acid receptor responder protein 1 [Camelus dromedarius]
MLAEVQESRAWVLMIKIVTINITDICEYLYPGPGTVQALFVLCLTLYNTLTEVSSSQMPSLTPFRKVAILPHFFFFTHHLLKTQDLFLVTPLSLDPLFSREKQEGELMWPRAQLRINQKKERKVDLVFTTELYNPEKSLSTEQTTTYCCQRTPAVYKELPSCVCLCIGATGSEKEPFHLIPKSFFQEGNKRLGKCSARVFFRNEKPRPAVNVTCAQLIEKKKRHEKDYQLYKRMKQLQNPVDVVSIPGMNNNHGHIDPSLKPIWDLAFLGSSYVMWEKTTQFLHYYMAQLSRVKQWKTNDDAIDFGYTVLLHEFSTQEIIPCHIHLVWYPGKPLKVKDHCQEPHTPEEASGTEEGSAVAPTELSNF